jgi:hypothetical protein
VVTNLESVHGAASLQASASIRRDIPGGVYFFSATGTIHANAIVVHRAAASARLAAVGGTEAHGMRVVDAASHIAGAGGTKSGLVEDLAGAARLVGLTHVDADAMRLAHGAARMPGVADMHAIGRRIVFGAGRIAGASNVRANGTVGNTGVWDLSSYDDGSVWG